MQVVKRFIFFNNNIHPFGVFCKEPRTDFLQYIDRHQCCPSCSKWPGVMAGLSGQILSLGPFQSAGISARGTPQDSVAVICLWPPMTVMEVMERKINSYLLRCLGLPRSLSSAALYGTSNARQLLFKGLVEEFVVSRTREAMMYRYSKDPKVAAAGTEVRTGRKWRAKKELGKSEERLRQKALVGTMAIDRAGLGYFPSIQIHKAKRKRRRNLI